MHTNCAVQYLRGVGLLFACVSAVIAAPLSASTSYANPANPSATTVVDRALPLSVSEYGGEPEPARGIDTAKSAGLELLVYTPEQGQESDDFSTVARHRGFRKFFLLVFICGAIIRFFTSPTFIAFIRDTLDPKVW